MKKLYVVTVEIPDANMEPPPEVRLKRMLKMALRVHGIVCKDYREVAVGDVPQDRKTPTE